MSGCLTEMIRNGKFTATHGSTRSRSQFEERIDIVFHRYPCLSLHHWGNEFQNSQIRSNHPPIKTSQRLTKHSEQALQEGHDVNDTKYQYKLWIEAMQRWYRAE